MGKLDLLKINHINPFLIDLRNEDSVSKLSDFLKSDILIIAIPPRVKVQNDYQNQITKLIPFVERSSVEKVILISSTSVYPNANSEVSEEFQGIPDSASGKVLLEVENLLFHNHKFDTTILRMAGLYGYDRKPGRFLAGKKGLDNHNGAVNLIHQDDCIAIINKIIEKGIWNEVFNCCSDKHPGRKEFYTKAALTLGLEPPEFLDNSLTSHKIISNNKLKKILGYQFKYPDPMELV
ncbi:SDR family NAD(P)-dependent oxidoreductase [Reichenbachiella sp. MALMAid0571]|uniref:SDR family NAD(P)-dependent oxidoreductase n=1 Tax=Reichenbachiella sp. MALMAid0571 TaxID=3143939 RepID=UPI0032DE4381